MALPQFQFRALSEPIEQVARETLDDGKPFLDMDAQYQRGHVWGTERRRNLIRSGKQRIHTLRMWLNDQLPAPRWRFANDQLMPEAHGKDEAAFSGLTVGWQRHMRNRTAQTHTTELRDIPERSAVEQEQELFELLTSSPRLKAGDSRG